VDRLLIRRLQVRALRERLGPPGGVLGEQLVGGVRVRPVLPHLGDLPITNVEDQRAVVFKRPARPLGVALVEADRMLVVGDDVVDLNPEVAAGQLHDLAEEAEHGVDASVIAGQLATARGVPDDVGMVQLPQGVHVPSAEGVVAPPDEVLVGMAHGRPLAVAVETRTIATRKPHHKSWQLLSSLSDWALDATARQTRWSGTDTHPGRPRGRPEAQSTRFRSGALRLSACSARSTMRSMFCLVLPGPTLTTDPP
jgi:hypothetical protein